jgi:hypothetical protein
MTAFRASEKSVAECAMAGALTRITEVEVSGCGQMQALIILARCQNLPSVQFHMAGPVASQE